MNGTGSEYAIEVENLAKVYDMGAEKVHALRGVSARFRRGEFWAVMVENHTCVFYLSE